LVERQPISSEELMRRVQAGNRQDLSLLMRRHANPLLTFLERMTGDHHLSEELFQETFLVVWTDRSRYEYPKTFRLWLFGIAANKCRTAVRARQRRLASLGQLQSQSQTAKSDTPLDSAVATETASLVEQAVLQLTDQQREVVVMRVWSGLSYEAIGEALDRTEGTVRSHMCHALSAMRIFLEPRLRDAGN
jgi:RNA polymerase sigma-70 factor (ECF subfamily)